MPLDYRFAVDSVSRIELTRCARSSLPKYGHLHAWGTTAQGVYRAGDTMDWKIYVRDQSNETFVAAPAGPYTLDIVDPTGQVVHTVRRRDAVEVRRVERQRTRFRSRPPSAGISFV